MPCQQYMHARFGVTKVTRTRDLLTMVHCRNSSRLLGFYTTVISNARLRACSLGGSTPFLNAKLPEKPKCALKKSVCVCASEREIRVKKRTDRQTLRNFPRNNTCGLSMSDRSNKITVTRMSMPVPMPLSFQHFRRYN